MVTVKTLFDALSASELRNLGFGSIVEDGIEQKDLGTIIPIMNSGLRMIYTEIPLKVSQIHFKTRPFQTIYKFSSANSRSKGGFILDGYGDSGEFLDDLLKIDRVDDEMGNEYPINDRLMNNSIYTPEYNKIEIPFIGRHPRILRLTYRASHKPIPMLPINEVVNVEMELPESLINALCIYIGSNIRAGLVKGDNVSVTGVDLSSFMMEIMRLKKTNLFLRDVSTNLIFEFTGFP